MSKKVEKLKREARQQEDRRNWVAAIELYGRAVSAAREDGLSPSEVGIYNRIGDLYLKLDDVSQAVYHYLLAVDEYADAEMYPPAVALCRKILRVAPDQVEAYRKLARLHAATGLMADARQEFDRYLSGVRESGELQSAVEGLEEVAGALMNGHFDAEAFRRLREDGEHEQAFELVLDRWASVDFEAAPAEDRSDADEPGETAPAEDSGEAAAAEEQSPAGRDGRGSAGDEGEPGAEADGTGPDDDAGWARTVVQGPGSEPADDQEAAGAVAADGTPAPGTSTETGTPTDAGVDAADTDVEATDAARELAGEFGIDLARLEGSGQAGRILKADVEAALVRGIEARPASSTRPGPGVDAEAGAPEADEPGDADGDVRATEAARRLADEQGVDLASVEGTGESGRVLKGDVEEVLPDDGPPEFAEAGDAVVVPAAEGLLVRAPRVERSAAREALARYEPPLVVAPVTAADLARLVRAPRVERPAAREALARYEPPLVVAPVTAADLAPLARAPRVERSAAAEALERYEPPVVVAPIVVEGLAPLARTPAVEPSAALRALAAYEPPAVVAPVTVEDAVPPARTPVVPTEAALRARAAYEPPAIVAPVTAADLAPLARAPRVERSAAREALARYEPPVVVAPIVVEGVAPLALAPRPEPSAARAALARYEPPVVVAPIVVEGVAPLVRAPRVERSAAAEALERYEPPLVVAPVTAADLAPLARAPRVERSAARAALARYEPPVVVAPIVAEELAPLALAPRPERSAAREALARYEPPVVVAPIVAEELAPLARAPRVERSAAREALARYEPPVVVAPILVESVAPLARTPQVEPSAAREALERYEPPVAVAPVTVEPSARLRKEPRTAYRAATVALAAYEEPVLIVPADVDGVPPLARQPSVTGEQARRAVEAFEPSEELRALAEATFELIGLGPGGPERETAAEGFTAPGVDGDDGAAAAGEEDASDDDSDGASRSPDLPGAGGETEEPVAADPGRAGRTDRDGTPDFTELLDEIGWLGGGDSEETAREEPAARPSADGRDGGHRNGNGNGDGAAAGAAGHGSGAGAPPVDDPRLRKTLAPWAVEPREGLGPGAKDGDSGGPEELDFTDLLEEVGWLRENETS